MQHDKRGERICGEDDVVGFDDESQDGVAGVWAILYMWASSPFVFFTFFFWFSVGVVWVTRGRLSTISQSARS